MSIVKMKRIRLFGMRSDREEILRVLQRAGCVEIAEPSDLEGAAWQGLSRPDDRALNEAREASAAASAALDICACKGRAAQSAPRHLRAGVL